MTLQVGWGQRLLGLLTLLGVIAVLALLRFDVPWPTAVALGLIGSAGLVSTIANFGQRLHANDEGLVWENVLLRGLGFGPRRAAWSDVVAAVELDRKTFFLTVEGQRRWVLDALDGPDLLRERLREHGIPVEERTRPRLRDFAGRRPPAG